MAAFARRQHHTEDRWPAEALGRLADPRAVDLLSAALSDEIRLVRQTAAIALGRIADRRAVAPLIGALGSKGTAVRGCAAEALGKIGDASAVPPLIAALADRAKDDDVGSHTNVCLLRFAAYPPARLVRRSAAWASGRIGDPTAAGPLQALLRDGHPLVCAEAERALAGLQGGVAPAVQPAAGLLELVCPMCDAVYRIGQGQRPGFAQKPGLCASPLPT